MGDGRGSKGGSRAPWILRISEKKVFFSVSTGKYQISSLVAPS